MSWAGFEPVASTSQSKCTSQGLIRAWDQVPGGGGAGFVYVLHAGGWMHAWDWWAAAHSEGMRVGGTALKGAAEVMG